MNRTLIGRLALNLLVDGVLLVGFFLGMGRLGAVAIGMACRTGEFPEVLCYRHGDPPGGFWMMLFVFAFFGAFLIIPVVHVLKVPIRLRWCVGASLLLVGILFRPLDEMIWEPIDAGQIVFPPLDTFRR
jgi:hypothetical protein